MKLHLLVVVLAVLVSVALGQSNRGVCSAISTPSLQNSECRSIKSCSSDLSAIRLTPTACPRLPTPEIFCSWTAVRSLLDYCGGDGDCTFSFPPKFFSSIVRHYEWVKSHFGVYFWSSLGKTSNTAPPPVRPITASKARMCYDDCLRCYMPSQCASGSLNIPVEISPFPSGFSYSIAPRGDTDCTNYFNSASLVMPTLSATLLVAIFSLFFL
jgi:hypothetical protein